MVYNNGSHNAMYHGDDVANGVNLRPPNPISDFQFMTHNPLRRGDNLITKFNYHTP